MEGPLNWWKSYCGLGWHSPNFFWCQWIEISIEILKISCPNNILKISPSRCIQEFLCYSTTKPQPCSVVQFRDTSEHVFWCLLGSISLYFNLHWNAFLSHGIIAVSQKGFWIRACICWIFEWSRYHGNRPLSCIAWQLFATHKHKISIGLGCIPTMYIESQCRLMWLWVLLIPTETCSIMCQNVSIVYIVTRNSFSAFQTKLESPHLNVHSPSTLYNRNQWTEDKQDCHIKE